ncbi:Outer membrane protein assembly factor BamB [subsurface metagenome]
MTKPKALFLFALLVGGCLLLSGCAAIGTATPIGWSAPVMDDDVIYVGTTEGKVVSYTLFSEPRVAAEWWRFPLRGELGLGGGGGGGFLACMPTAPAVIYSTPFVADGAVYIGAYDGKVYALNTSSRVAGYSFPQESEGEWVYPEEDSIGAIVGSPVVAEGILYIGSADGNLYAIDIVTSELAWDSPFATGDDIWATPLVHDGVVYIGSFDHKLYAIDAADGTLVWESPFQTDGAIAATPLFYNNTIYIGSFDRKFYAVDTSTGKAKEGFIPFPAGNWFWGRAVAYDDTIIVGCVDGRVYALDAETGERQWSFPELDEGAVGPVRGDPALAGEVVIFGSDDGRVYALDAASGHLIWDYPHGEDRFGPIRASLYAGDGEVYVHDTRNHYIYALGVEHGNVLWSVSTAE